MRTLCLTALLVAAPSFAATQPIAWQHPTSGMDGVLLPATGPLSLASTRVEWGTCANGLFGVKAGQTIVPFPASTVTVTLQPGNYCFRAYSKNVEGSESDSSNVVAKTVVGIRPNPPVLL